MMNQRISFLQKALLCTFCFFFAQTMTGTEQFIQFKPTNDTWKLGTITIGYADSEHSCVQLAAANLAKTLNKLLALRA